MMKLKLERCLMHRLGLKTHRIYQATFLTLMRSKSSLKCFNGTPRYQSIPSQGLFLKQCKFRSLPRSTAKHILIKFDHKSFDSRVEFPNSVKFYAEN